MTAHPEACRRRCACRASLSRHSQATAENLATGMAPEEAAREARKRFGNLQSVHQESREARDANWGESIWQDVRIGLRMLRKHLGATSVAALWLVLSSLLVSAEPKMAFWNTPRQGANFFNHVELKERFEAARQAGVDFVRLAPNKWLNGRPESRRGDFLLGCPEAFSRLDTNTLYSFHFYEPFAFTNHKNKGRYACPGQVPTGESETPTMEQWDRARMRSFLQPVLDWQARWQIPSRRILVGELGVCRLNQGATQYLDDALTVFSEQGWHWAFYSFREDNWDLMDYELATAKPTAAYWQAIDAGRMPGHDVYRGSPIFDVIQKRLSQKRHPEIPQTNP